MKKKILMIVMCNVMVIGSFGCNNIKEAEKDESIQKTTETLTIETEADETETKNVTITINGTIYDLSKDFDEILEDFVDNTCLSGTFLEEEKMIRKEEKYEVFDSELGYYTTKYEYYELDNNDSYILTDPKDFDERVMMTLLNVYCNTLEFEMEEIVSLTIENHKLNAPNLEIKTVNGIGLGSSEFDLEKVGAIKSYGNVFEIIYLDGELVDYSDYSKDVDRIQNLDSDEWNDELQNNYLYQCLQADYMHTFNNVDDEEKMTYLLAKADAFSQINSGEKGTMLQFDYKVSDGKVSSISFTITKQSNSGKTDYENFTESKK